MISVGEFATLLLTILNVDLVSTEFMMTSKKKASDYQYLIVGGTTKAATTSLFVYLADHPSICGATYKETRFFLHNDYPLPSKYRYRGDIEEYNLLFPPSDENQIRLESTPDYLYCPCALERIATLLPHTKLVFSLRDPISRLISWYRFAKQIGRLPETLSFDGYVELLLARAYRENQWDNVEASEPPKETAVQRDTKLENNINHEQYMKALEQGCYAACLKKYIQRFGTEHIHLLFYEDLASHPLKVLMNLCHFAGVDPDFYTDYTFKVANRTETMRNSELHRKYRDFRFQVRRWTHNKPIIHRSLQGVRRAIEPLYLRLNTRPDQSVSISEKTQNRLIDYYEHDVRELTELIGRQPPWKPFA